VGRYDEDDDSGCPECGSHCLRRVEGPDARSIGVKEIDLTRSGYYVCEKCMTEHYAEFEKPKPKSPAEHLPGFSPTAQCPHCKSYETSVRYIYVVGDTRTHRCKSCDKSFKTRILDRGDD
jgi:protein-arginine kinase activator protein McsA